MSLTPADSPSHHYLDALNRDLAARCAVLVEQASGLSDQLYAWLDENSLDRSILAIDDSPTALWRLVDALLPLGVPVYAVTDDPTCVSTLKGLGAHVHVVSEMGEAAQVWAELRSAVVVSDLTLGNGVSGLSVLQSLGRGPRCVLVTSRDDVAERAPLTQAADTVQAMFVRRTLSGEWEEQLRRNVKHLLDSTREEK